MEFEKVFGRKPVFGMIHTGNSSDMDMLELAKMEIEIYLRHGIYPLVENYFGNADDCEEVLKWMQQNHPEAIYGLNILGDYILAFELARKYGAKFIQIDSVSGHLVPERDEKYAKNLLYLRKQYPEIEVFGGVRFKYQAVRSGRSLDMDLLLGTGRCDAIVCTGEGTGKSTPFTKVEEFKRKVGDFPVIVGAGVTAGTARETAVTADGAIVGSWLKEGHRDKGIVNESYVEEFMRNWKKGFLGKMKEGSDMYEELTENDYYRSHCYRWDSEDKDHMQTINSLVNEYWKPRYILDHTRKVAYEIMDNYQRWTHFSVDDIDWESIKNLSEEALDNARRLSAYFPSFIRNYKNGTAIVEWQLIPDGMYWMDEDGYGMTSDEEVALYAVIDKDMNVLVKFRYIGRDFNQLEKMREEACEQL